MKDERGHYYYPFPQNKRVRMYVRQGETGVDFRLWNQDDPQLWIEHGWVPHAAITAASAIYQKKGFDPHLAYDIKLARALLTEPS
ncbi:MAG TPA: hypothetical protein VK852_06690 [Desulfobacterales bacterium]|nr:hypothetical protein [Desulfobacterales bacterium]